MIGVELWLPWQHIAPIDLTWEKSYHHSSSFIFFRSPSFLLITRTGIKSRFDFGLAGGCLDFRVIGSWARLASRGPCLTRKHFNQNIYAEYWLGRTDRQRKGLTTRQWTDSVLGVCNYGYVPLSHLENIIMRIETTTTTTFWAESVCSLRSYEPLSIRKFGHRLNMGKMLSSR